LLSVELDNAVMERRKAGMRFQPHSERKLAVEAAAIGRGAVCMAKQVASMKKILIIVLHWFVQ
jgi:hypothetical protein